MEVTQEELLEQSKTSALEAALWKSRASRATGMYAALHSEAKRARDNMDFEAIAEENVEPNFDFLDKFPATIEF